MNLHRYFTGHTKDPNGTRQFIAGHTKVSHAVDGAIKILTVAVCLLFAEYMFMYLCIDVYVTSLINNKKFQVTIVVVAVPEGLPLAVTLT